MDLHSLGEHKHVQRSIENRFKSMQQNQRCRLFILCILRPRQSTDVDLTVDTSVADPASLR